MLWQQDVIHVYCVTSNATMQTISHLDKCTSDYSLIWCTNSSSGQSLPWTAQWRCKLCRKRSCKWEVVNPAYELLQNCTAAGKVTLEELSTHLLPNLDIQVSFSPFPQEQKAAMHGMGLRSSSRQASHRATCLPQANWLVPFSSLSAVPLMGPWTSQEDGSELHPSTRHKWSTIFLFCFPHALWLTEGHCEAPRSQDLTLRMKLPFHQQTLGTSHWSLCPFPIPVCISCSYYCGDIK